MKHKLPIGIQDFAKLRTGGCLYVDKTDVIHHLLTKTAGPVFLSRPRRFGKSLLCSTLSALFECRRELFKSIDGDPALAIDSLDRDWKTYPVIKLDLNPGDYSQGVQTLNTQIHLSLKSCGEKYAVNADSTSDISAHFRTLIEELYKKYNEKVVVIIDEYDKPLLSTIDTGELHKNMRNALKGFYSVLKSSDEYLHFVFITGVTKFAQVSIFSDLNNLTDISLNPDYNNICGITQEELEHNFENEIIEIVQNKKCSKEDYLTELKRFYNGYRFSEAPSTVYNPFGLLNHFFNRGKFNSYWFSTGTPVFLVKLIENQHIDILNLEKKQITLNSFNKFDVENMEAVPVLYQSGYLTVVDYDEETNVYSLDYPNVEVRASFADSLMEHYLHVPASNLQPLTISLPEALRNGDVDGAMNALIPFFAAIPYDIQIKQERYYQTVVYLIFRMLGLYCQTEVRTARGRIDAIVETKNYAYCFEFKLDGTAAKALQQINDKDYLLPWMGSDKKLIKVGVVFNSEKRNIDKWEFSNN
jgi:hypothetical protein